MSGNPAKTGPFAFEPRARMNVDRATLFLAIDTLAHEVREAQHHTRLRPMENDFLEAERDSELVRQFRRRIAQCAEALEIWGNTAEGIIEAHMANKKQP